MTETVHTIELVVFWASAGIIAFTYVGYPLLLFGAAHLFGRRPTPPDAGGGDAPSVALLIVVHNEEDVIAQRLEDAAALSYPRDRFEIVVASDGSSDRTAAIVRSCGIAGVRLIEFADRRGKTAVLNEVLPGLHGEIVVLSDANTCTHKDAVRKLARWFADPGVGVVCGKLRLVDRTDGTNVDGLYWRLETALKEREAWLGGIIGANGAIYAIRRSVFAPIPDDTVIEDLVIPLKARLASGCRIVFDSEAMADERTAPHIRMEFQRRARIGAGGFQAIGQLWRLLDPRQGWIAVSLFSHKVLRWWCPLFLLALLAVNVPLASQPFFAVTLAAQVTFHLGAVLLLGSPICARLPRLLRLALMFDTMNAALLVGLWRWLTGTQSSAWRHTSRDPLHAAGGRESMSTSSTLSTR